MSARVHVELGLLEPGDLFHQAGRHPDPERTYELVEHGPTWSVVRQVVHGEQVEFTDPDGGPVDAHRRHTERWAIQTLVTLVKPQ